MDLTQSLIEILIARFDVDSAEIGPETTFEELNLDSLVLIELSLVLERELGTEVPEGLLDLEQTMSQAAAQLPATGARN